MVKITQNKKCIMWVSGVTLWPVRAVINIKWQIKWSKSASSSRCPTDIFNCSCAKIQDYWKHERKSWIQKNNNYPCWKGCFVVTRWQLKFHSAKVQIYLLDLVYNNLLKNFWIIFLWIWAFLSIFKFIKGTLKSVETSCSDLFIYLFIYYFTIKLNLTHGLTHWLTKHAGIRSFLPTT